ncbi:hypothetical protein [Caudoviricetes sp.]|nr:hypothetical protein [Caudoviricetes sp.]
MIDHFINCVTHILPFISSRSPASRRCQFLLTSTD